MHQSPQPDPVEQRGQGYLTSKNPGSFMNKKSKEVPWAVCV